MSELTVRQLPFDFAGVRFLWNPRNRGFSTWANAISFGAIGFETWLVRVMQEIQPRITCPELAEESLRFTKQEAVHAAAHSKHVKALIARYPGLANTRKRSIAEFARWREELPLQDNLCAIAALEATFTPSFKLIIDHREALMGGGDERVASLLLWHFCEEIEHRSSALKIYRHVYRDRFGPIRRFPEIRRRVSTFLAMLREEFRAHVPREESSTRGQRAFNNLPRRDKWVASARILLSQTPWHNPQHAPIPAGSELWFEAYGRGEDMTRFLGAPPA
jgi:predicted metal-dependent hydrolase